MTELTYQYAKYRGKCKEYCDAMLKEDPTLTLKRGYYHCTWSATREPHWWLVDTEGNIVDPTAEQFMSLGRGVYEEYDGEPVCEDCGTKKPEKEFYVLVPYPICSVECYGNFVIGDL